MKTKLVSWFSIVIGQTPGQNMSRQLATSSENLVASAQFLVALATSKSQFQTLHPIIVFVEQNIVRYARLQCSK